jgi:CspA family cold shock protein
MKIKIIVTLLFTLALKFNAIAAERVENEKKTPESVFAVAKQTEMFDTDVLKAEKKGLSMSEGAELLERAIKDAKAQTHSGIVKWYDVNKGFGFISQDSGEKDVYVHSSEIQGDGPKILVKGQRVEYEIKQGPKGLQASNVKKLD